MKNMAEKHQVIAISHLPQIASKAQFHYNVFKNELADSTITEIELLDDTSRVEAIAKMLSDEQVTETTVKAAQELLK
jgi:DNA repair protein RecN (Recombination protein N)